MSHQGSQSLYSPQKKSKEVAIFCNCYRFIYHFSGINEYRTNPYHRLDISASYHPPRKKKFGFNWTAGIYNVYGSPGQYSYGLEGTLHNRSVVIVRKNQLFNITPYLSSTIDF